MTTSPILALPQFDLPFTVEIDASGITMGVFLVQQGHPIAFFSKTFCPRVHQASTYIQELYAITVAVRKWRQYLLGHRFTILTDHRSLRELMTQIIQTPEQQYHLAKLLGFDYDIQYKSGPSNVVPDSLSRIPAPEGKCLLLSTPNFLFMDQLRRTLQESDAFQTQSKLVREEPSTWTDFHISRDLLFYKNAIWINPGNPLIPALLMEFHSTPIGDHLGMRKTLHRLQASFYWPTMATNVKDFVRQCQVC